MRSNVRRFTAAYHSDCNGCLEPIEPGDQAGFIDGHDGAHCEACVDDADEGDDDE